MTSPPTADQPMFPFRAVILGALLPAFVFSIGVGAMLPIIAPFALQQGASFAVAGFIAAMLPVGQILADLPAGALASRIGDRPAMLLASGVAVVGFLGAALSPSLLTLGASVLLVGAANAVFHLARHSYLTTMTDPRHRARVLSTLGGVQRIGQFVGPFLGALVIAGGGLRMVFVVATATAAAAAITVGLAKPKPQPGTEHLTPAEGPTTEPVRPRFWAIIVQHRRLLATLGLAGMLVGAIRGARQHVIPLWGAYIELDPTTISLIYGLAGGIDMLLFYPAGKIMDRFGRLWLCVPAMTLLGIAMALIPITATTTGLSAVAILLGFANGLGSGVMMTIASDVAPTNARPQFLGAWRLLFDIGMGAGPLLLSAGAALGSLAVGVWATSLMGALAAAGMQRWLPKYSEHAKRTARGFEGPPS